MVRLREPIIFGWIRTSKRKHSEHFTSSMASKLPIEVWQSVFLEFDSNSDRAEIFNCLLVSKRTNAAMQGPALLSSIWIRRTRQIPQLFLYLLERPSDALHIEQLVFDLAPSSPTEEQLSHELTPVSYLLHLCRKLNYLVNPPVLRRAYPQTVAAIRGLKLLRTLWVKDRNTRLFGSAAAVCQSFDLKDLHHLARELEHLHALFLQGYGSIPSNL